MSFGYGYSIDKIIPQGGGSGFVGILDEVPGATAARGIFLLSSTYTGSCMRVFRESDLSETDIGFVDGLVDFAAIQSFGSGGDTVRVLTMYDQTGNGFHWEQDIALQAPIILNAGVLEVLNGNPALYAPNNVRMLSDDYVVSIGSAANLTDVNYTHFITHANDGDTAGGIWGFSSNFATRLQLINSGTDYRWLQGQQSGGTVTFDISIADQTQTTFTCRAEEGISKEMWKDGVLSLSDYAAIDMELWNPVTVDKIALFAWDHNSTFNRTLRGWYQLDIWYSSALPISDVNKVNSAITNLLN